MRTFSCLAEKLDERELAQGLSAGARMRRDDTTAGTMKQGIDKAADTAKEGVDRASQTGEKLSTSGGEARIRRQEVEMPELLVERMHAPIWDRSLGPIYHILAGLNIFKIVQICQNLPKFENICI